MNIKPNKDDFNFEKVHILNGKVTITAFPVTKVDGIPYTHKMNADEYTMDPHEDLTSELEKLKKPLAKLHGLLDVETVVNAKDFEATPAQKKVAKTHTIVKLGEIEVTGIKVTGEDQNRKFMITGTYKGSAINTRSQKIIGMYDGLFEDDISIIVDKIIDETYQYCFEGKITPPQPINAEQENIAGDS